MTNSTRCPLCVDGIGHAMDEKHAERVNELLNALNNSLIALNGACDRDEYINHNVAIGQAMRVIQQCLAEGK